MTDSVLYLWLGACSVIVAKHCTQRLERHTLLPGLNPGTAKVKFAADESGRFGRLDPMPQRGG